MRSRFTSLAGLLLALLVGGCSSVNVSLPGAGGDQQRGVESVPDERDGAKVGAQSPAEIVVEIPRLHANTQAAFNSALAHMRVGAYAEAWPLLEHLTETQPELAGPWVNLGIIHAHNENTAQAREALAVALAANPHNCDALSQLGVLARREGRFADAERHYLACLDAQPGHAATYRNLGILFELYQGRLTDALVMYARYQALLAEPDIQVAGWMADLERRVAAIARR